MKRYVAFLRGVMPTNAKMPELKAAFEAAGFREVCTVLGSGNVVFDTGYTASTLERRIEKALTERLGRSFLTLVRDQALLDSLLQADPYAAFGLPSGSKRVVTFLREPLAAAPALPMEKDGAQVLLAREREIYSAWLPGADGPAFMAWIEKSFGKSLTTRTWETVRKCVAK
jgi:uncharacterized protein (DUF1697 family)